MPSPIPGESSPLSQVMKFGFEAGRALYDPRQEQSEVNLVSGFRPTPGMVLPYSGEYAIPLPMLGTVASPGYFVSEGVGAPDTLRLLKDAAPRISSGAAQLLRSYQSVKGPILVALARAPNPWAKASVPLLMGGENLVEWYLENTAEKGDARESTSNFVAAALSMKDIAKAYDIVRLYDPRPGSIDARFIAEEQDCALLEDPVLHEMARSRWMRNRRRLAGSYKRDVRVITRQPLGYGYLSERHIEPGTNAWTQNMYTRSNPISREMIRQVEYAAFFPASNLNPTIGGPDDSPRNQIPTFYRPKVYDRGDTMVASEMDPCCAFQTVRPTLNDGVFYSTPTFVARIGETEPGVYGETRIDRLPFEVVISNRNIGDRALVSFVHEALHGYDELYKLGIGHDQLHQLAVFFKTEILPGYQKLRSQIRT